jgi:hypothetical protein
VPFAQAVCVDSECEIGLCLGLRDDCANGAADGCETDLLTSPQHCGRCERVCEFPGATPLCVGGDCRLGPCNAGVGNCDLNPANGCETSLLDSVDHCGACDAPCANPFSAIATCDDGLCAIGDCTDDQLDCNEIFEDGCEASRFSTETCLSCDNRCEFENAVAGCGTGGCFLARCIDGFVDLDRDRLSCEYECTPTNLGVETCDAVDNDCDGLVDEPDADNATIWFRDSDSDLWGDSGVQQRACSQPAGFVARAGDCRDDLPGINPGVAETCNGLDDNCIDGIDEGLSVDADRDGRYAIGSCTAPADDCDDGNEFRYPGYPERCDGFDNDCAAGIDPPGSLGCSDYYVDSDGDLYGTGAPLCLCSASGLYQTRQGGDCDDGNSDARPLQGSWFSTPRAGGSYDYDCNGNAEQRYTAVAGACELIISLNICSSPAAGYVGSVPACGASGTWATGCELRFGFDGIGCFRSGTSSRTQECR